MDLFGLGREQSRYYMDNHPNEIELHLSNGSSMYLHIDDFALKSLYNHFCNTSDSKMVVRNQYAQTLVFNALHRANDNSRVRHIQVAVRADRIVGFTHFGATVFQASRYRTVELMFGGHNLVFNTSFEDYEILRSHFIPNNNNDEPKAFPVWNANRCQPRKPNGQPINVRNQWEKSFVFRGTTHDFNSELRVARFVTLQDNVDGYINFDPSMD